MRFVTPYNSGSVDGTSARKKTAGAHMPPTRKVVANNIASHSSGGGVLVWSGPIAMPRPATSPKCRASCWSRGRQNVVPVHQLLTAPHYRPHPPPSNIHGPSRASHQQLSLGTPKPSPIRLCRCRMASCRMSHLSQCDKETLFVDD